MMVERMFAKVEDYLSIKQNQIIGSINGKQISGYFIEDKIVFALTFLNPVDANKALSIFRNNKDLFESYDFLQDLVSEYKVLYIKCDSLTFNKEDAQLFLSEFVLILEQNNIRTANSFEINVEKENKYFSLKFIISLFLNVALCFTILFFLSDLKSIIQIRVSDILLVFGSILLLCLYSIVSIFKSLRSNKETPSNQRDVKTKYPLKLFITQIITMAFSPVILSDNDIDTVLVTLLGLLLFISLNYGLTKRFVLSTSNRSKSYYRDNLIIFIQVAVGVFLSKVIYIISFAKYHGYQGIPFSYTGYQTSLRFLRNYDHVSTVNVLLKGYFVAFYLFIGFVLIVTLIKLFSSGSKYQVKHS